MSQPADTFPFQALLDDAVANGVAPGFQYVVFGRKSLIYNGVSGLAAAPTAHFPEGKPFRRDNIVWLASCSKIALSLIVLHIIERGLTKSGFSMKDLDSHEALVEVLPEFKHGSGSLLTKIIDGFEDRLDEEGRKIMKLREAKGRVTLRMLLTHTAGLAYDWNHPFLAELIRPSDDSVPHTRYVGVTGNIQDFEFPLVNEPDTAYHYGVAADWIGQFAVRSTGKTLRELHKQILFEPLGISPSEADIWISSSLAEALAPIHVRDPRKGFNHSPLGLPYATEGRPPEGKSYWASCCIVSSMQAYAKLLQAVLNQDPVILSKEIWQMAMQDDLHPRGLKLPKPEWKSMIPHMARDAEEFAKSTAVDGAGVNLLQTQVALAPTLSGRSAGSISWAGFTNVYFFIDPTKGVGAILGTHLLPYFDAHVVDLRDRLEALVYRTMFGE